MKYPILFSRSIVTVLLLWASTITGIALAEETAIPALRLGHTPFLSLRTSVATSTDRLIVKYREPVATTAAVETISAHISQTTGFGVARFGRTHSGAQILKLNKRLPLNALRGIIEEIKGYPGVEYVEPDLVMLPFYTPNDPRYNEQWHYFEAGGGIALPAAWDLTRGENSVVAVVDTGYLPHPDLLPNLLPGYDMIRDPSVANDGDGRDGDARDPGDYAPDCGVSQSSWHGTHVAGTIAAMGNNGIGVTGVAFQANILPVRVLGKCGGYLSDIADGIVWASGATVTGVPLNQRPAQVINLSFGGRASSCPQTLQRAINTARQQGAAIVVAAGNDGELSTLTAPANCNGVISVAATTRSANLAPFSNYGGGVDIAAPGMNILSTYNEGRIASGGNNYAILSGTSMSAPHVSGVASLLYAIKPDITPDEAEQILKATARPFPNPCVGCGAGILDAAAAVQGLGEAPGPKDSGLILLENGSAVTRLSGAQNAMLQFAIDVPAGATDLSFSLSGGAGDADLYMRFGETPTLNLFNCRPYRNGNAETCLVGTVQPGRYYVMLHGYTAFSNTTLVATYHLESGQSATITNFENQTDYPIPNYLSNGVSSPIAVTREGESGTIDIEVKIRHDSIQEISVDLLDPQGKIHNLKGFGGSDGVDLNQSYSLDLRSQTSAGTWALRVRDFGSQGVGYLDGWQITFH